MSNELEEKHCKIEAEPVVSRHQHRGEIGGQYRRTLPLLTFAIAAILYRNRLKMCDESKESGPGHAEVGPRSDLVRLYAVDVKRSVFCARANNRGKRCAAGSWV